MIANDIKKFWDRMFLGERPSISLSLFRIAVALTTGFHLLPTFVPLRDTYLSTALKSFNGNFFTVGAIELVQKSPDSLVIFFVALFCAAWLCFLVGLFSQISCILMTVCCYYFYALNTFAIGQVLSWDILLVTLVLMCVVPYHGDYFSLDCLRRRDLNAYRRERPYFLQRLLQLQIAFTFFYTGLNKISAQGNWLTDNPIYYLMNYPAAGVTKHFLFKEFLSHHPGLCYGIGIIVLSVEIAMPVLLFWRRTRVSAITLGLVFHVLLILTLDVPAIFFFLFPAQLLLFINPKKNLQGIEQKRRTHQTAPAQTVIYDGQCGFCRDSVQALRVMDLWASIKLLDYHELMDLQKIHPDLEHQDLEEEIHLIETGGRVFKGFFAFRRLCWTLPMMVPLLPLFYFPGAGLLGPVIYRWIARHRYLFARQKACVVR